jgi:hypothetical protein
MHIEYTDKPKGRLPLSKGMADDVLNMRTRTQANLAEDHHNFLGWFLRQAVANPGVLQVRYHEEPGNRYEYEDRATYDSITNTITTNLYCPVSYGHHIGQTCGMCGLKD